jgi:twinfilin
LKSKRADLCAQIEATDPSEITEGSLLAEFAPREEIKVGFAKPKRPGRR